MSGRLRQKKFHEFKASLSYIVSLRSALTGRFNGGKRRRTVYFHNDGEHAKDNSSYCRFSCRLYLGGFSHLLWLGYNFIVRVFFF